MMLNIKFDINLGEEGVAAANELTAVEAYCLLIKELDMIDDQYRIKFIGDRNPNNSLPERQFKDDKKLYYKKRQWRNLCNRKYNNYNRNR